MRILVMRHGFNIRDPDTKTDEGLAEEGKRQVEEAAKDHKYETISAIYSSSTLRARQTAFIVSKELEAPVIVLESLRDIEISWEKLTTIPRAQLETLKWLEAWIDGFPGFEPSADFLNRIKDAVESITSRHNNTETILIVGHEETVWAMMSLINKAPIQEAAKTKIKHASITEFYLEACQR